MDDPVKDIQVSSPTSPRPLARPSGPRTRRPNFKTAAPLSISGGISPVDETVPAYSGRNSPTSQVSSRPQSPFLASMPSLSQLSERAFINSKPPLRRDQAVQVDPAPTPSSRASTPAVKILIKSPSLDPPPALNFESNPVPWKGLTLQAAQWTLTSEQLQDIVSRAIRMSAQEGFIKLLSVKTLDEELVEEMQRLDTLKATTQSQYRFNMHRRSMLLQSLLALAAGGDADNPAMVNLTTQLAEITVSCDRLMESMVRIADQRAQIQHLQEVHISSALAMALRKLNGSYAKRTSELKEARGQIDHLKAELEEAWNVAEDMAQEMDDLDNFHSGFSSGGEDEDDTTSGSGMLRTGEDETFNDESVRLARVVEITGTAVASKATLTNFGEGSPTALLVPDRDMDRTSRVSAAKKRSSRASKASLRMPKTSTGPPTADRSSVFSRRSRSKSLRGRSGDEAGPTVPPMPGSGPIDSFLEMSETRPTSPAQVDVEAAPPVPQLSLSPEPVAPISPRPTTPQFEIPPITIDYADDNQRNPIPTRRIKSMQPPLRARSLDDSDVDTSNKHVSKVEYKKFDGWPWVMASKKNKRHSLPLTRISLDEAKKDVAEKAMSPLRKDPEPPSDTKDNLT